MSQCGVRGKVDWFHWGIPKKRFFRNFKTEWMLTVGYCSSSEAKVAITEYIIRYYNQVRPHQYNESERRFNN